MPLSRGSTSGGESGNLRNLSVILDKKGLGKKNVSELTVSFGGGGWWGVLGGGGGGGWGGGGGGVWGGAGLKRNPLFGKKRP